MKKHCRLFLLFSFIAASLITTNLTSQQAHAVEESFTRDAQTEEQPSTPAPAADAPSVELDPQLNWRASHWAGASQASVVSSEQIDDGMRFSVADKKKFHVWTHYFAVPIEVPQYPLIKMRYRATNLNTEFGSYGIWLDDTTGPDHGGIYTFKHTQLIDDGQIHTITKDLREGGFNKKHAFQDKITGVALGVYSDETGNAQFDLLELSFIHLPDAEAVTEYEEAEAVSVNVKDSDGNPVEGALVTIDSAQLTFSDAISTDKAGKAELIPIANKAGKHGLTVEKEGFLTVTKKDIAPGSTVDVVLTTGTTYGGYVEDSNGKPIVGAGVNFWISSKDIRHTNHNTVTDTNGYWETGLMPSGAKNFGLTVKHPEYVTQQAWASSGKPSFDELEQHTALSILDKGTSFSGYVRDIEGNPIDKVSLQINESSNRSSTQSDTAGYFTFTNAQKGRVKLLAQKKGYAPNQITISVTDQMQPVEIILSGGKAIRGQIVDEYNEPLPKVNISARGLRGRSGGSWSSITDTEGRFCWENAPDKTMGFSFYLEGYMSINAYQLKPAEAEYVISMYKKMQISGIVIDAETGDTIPSFTLIPGFQWDERHSNISWQNHGHWKKQYTDGAFSYELTRKCPQYGIRIEADGYFPLESRPFTLDEADTELVFELEKYDNMIEGTVVFKDNTPAAGVEVMLTHRQNSAYIRNGTINTYGDEDKTKITNADGSFAFPPVQENYGLLVCCDTGYAAITGADFEQTHQVILEPWGIVKGTAYVGSVPAVNAQIRINRNDHEARKQGLHFYHDLQTKTDRSGKFIFYNVPSGEAQIYRQQKLTENSYRASISIPINVIAGDTITVQIGGTGRPVIGQVKLPKSVSRQIDWKYANVSLRSKTGIIDKIKKRSKPTVHYGSTINDDGSFRIDDVVPGKYGLDIRANEPPQDEYRGWGKQIGSVTHEFTIPKIEGGRSDKPLDLGELMLRIYNDLKIGDVAPDFEFNSLTDTSTIKLYDYRNKPVLVYLWSPKQKSVEQQQDYLNELYKEFGNDNHLVFIGLSIAHGNDTAHLCEFLEKNPLPGIQGYITDWANASFRYDYNPKSSPANYLIDPKRKIVALYMKEGELVSEVKRYFGIHEKFEVKLLEQVGQIKFGMSETEVKKLLGEPEKYLDNGRSWAYASRGFTIAMSPSTGACRFNCYTKKAVWPALLAKDFAGITTEGIKMGASESDIIKAHGEPDEKSTKGKQVDLTYKALGVHFTLLKDKLLQFSVDSKPLL